MLVDCCVFAFLKLGLALVLFVKCSCAQLHQGSPREDGGIACDLFMRSQTTLISRPEAITVRYANGQVDHPYGLLHHVCLL